MNRFFLAGFCIFFIYCNLFAQTVDLTSVDEFFKVTSALRGGNEVSADQWKAFEMSSGYRDYSEREDQTYIRTIKESVNIVFGTGNPAVRDSILKIQLEESIGENTLKLLSKLILINYIDVDSHFSEIKSFRETYNFNHLVVKAKQRLSSFLGIQLDSTIAFKPINFYFVLADGAAKADALYIDFNLIYKQTEEQRINFIAHEYFHDLREKYENHEFNYKCDLNRVIDNIQNEGIADLIDKSDGYEKYFTNVGETPEMIEIWVNLYNCRV